MDDVSLKLPYVQKLDKAVKEAKKKENGGMSI